MKKYYLSFIVVFISTAALLIGFGADGQTDTPVPSFEVADQPAPELVGGEMTVSSDIIVANQLISFSGEIIEPAGVVSAVLRVNNSSGTAVATINLYDDGLHSDGAADDSVFANTWNTGSNALGEYSLSLAMEDRFGYEATVDAGTFTIGTPPATDTTPPTVNITSPADGATVTASPITINATATDNTGIQRVEFYLGESLITTQDYDSPEGSNVYSAALSLPSAGSYQIKAVAYDDAGNTNLSIITITYDPPVNSAPFNVSITSPANNATVTCGTNMTITVHAEDDAGVATVRLYNNRAGLLNTLAATGTSVNVNFTVLMNSSILSMAAAADGWPSLVKDDHGFKLPFIPTAYAADDVNCTTTTSTYWGNFYAIAYDAGSLSTQGGIVSLGCTSSTTTCTNTNTPTTPN